MKPDIGETQETIHAQLSSHITQGGSSVFSLTQGHTLRPGEPKIIPLKKESGKWQSLVIEAHYTDPLIRE